MDWIKPTWHANALLLVCVSLIVATVLTGSPYPAAFAAGAFLSLVATYVGAYKRVRDTEIQVKRRLSKEDVSRGGAFDVMLDASGSRIPKGVHTRFTDAVPKGVEARAGWRQVGPATLAYPARAAFRGPAGFDAVAVDVEDSTGMWSQSRTLSAPAELHVLPGEEARMLGQRLLTPTRMDHALPGTVQSLFRDHREDRVAPYGSGHRMRDIDWKAYARHRKLLVRQWSQQEDAKITVLLDGGRHMRGDGTDVPRLEGAVDMALELATAAIRFNHAVGAVLFDGDRVLGNWRMARDRGAMQRLQAGLLDAATADHPRARRRLTKGSPDQHVSRIVRSLPGRSRGGCLLMIADVHHLDDTTVAHMADAVSKGQRLVVFPLGASTDRSDAILARLRARGAEVMAVPGTRSDTVKPVAPEVA